MSQSIAEKWLQDSAHTANAKDFTAHMDLISKRISLHGVPDFETIGYEEWARQCQYEFENNILKSVRYDGFKLVADTSDRIMFKTFETVEAMDGTINAQGVEMLLEKEDDGKWRLVQERVLPPDEAAHDKLIP
jgi:ketosteroid isomerase-like protein